MESPKIVFLILGHHVRSGMSGPHHAGLYMHSNNDILDVVDVQSSVGGVGGGTPSCAGGVGPHHPHHPLHQQWSRDSLLGRSYRDVREVVAVNTLPGSYGTGTAMPASHSRDNTLSRDIHHLTVSLLTYDVVLS